MSFYENATYGKVSILGTMEYIYLNHPFSLHYPSHTEVNQAFYLHCMALTREEAKDLIVGLESWLSLTREKQC